MTRYNTVWILKGTACTDGVIPPGGSVTFAVFSLTQNAKSYRLLHCSFSSGGFVGNLCFVCLERVIGLLSSYFQSILNHIWEEKMSTESIIEYVKKCFIICGLRKADEND